MKKVEKSRIEMKMKITPAMTKVPGICRQNRITPVHTFGVQSVSIFGSNPLCALRRCAFGQAKC